MPDDYKPLIDLNSLPADLINTPIARDIYTGSDPAHPKGMENIRGAGSLRGGLVATSHYKAHLIVKDLKMLDELARREFIRWWAEEKRSYPSYLNEDPDSFDVELMQRVYVPNFRKSYTHYFENLKKSGGYKSHIETFEELELPPLPPGPTARVMNTHRSEGSRLYEVELVDPDYPDDRIRFEVQVGSHGETDVRE